MTKVILINSNISIHRMESWFNSVGKALLDGGIIEAGTPILRQANLPTEDEDGRPILAFLVETDVVWAWKGEPVKLSEDNKLYLELIR